MVELFMQFIFANTLTQKKTQTLLNYLNLASFIHHTYLNESLVNRDCFQFNPIQQKNFKLAMKMNLLMTTL